jgi:hypothetical protein
MKPLEADMKTVRIDCTTCGEEFEKPSKEHRRKLRLGKTEFFCSRSCAGKSVGNKKHLKTAGKLSAEVFSISEWSDNRRDAYTGLREHLSRARARVEKYDGLTLDDLLEAWQIQGGMCAITGVKLIHPGCQGHSISKNYLASLDRIDSSKGYKKGNVQFISATANNLKNDMTQQEVDEFLSIVQGIQRRDLSTA